MNRYKSTKAFTLVELAITIALVLVVAVAVTKFFQSSQSTFYHTYDRIKARKEASLVLRTMKKEIRQISQSSKDFETLEEASGNKIAFYADIDSDTKPEKVTYSLNDKTLSKTVIKASSEGPPWIFNGSSSTLTLTKYAENTQKNIFTYYSDIDVILNNLPLSKTNREQVKIIKINIGVLYPKGIKEDDLECEIYLRNKNDPL